MIHLFCFQIQSCYSWQVSYQHFWSFWRRYVCINFYWRHIYTVYWNWNWARQWCRRNFYNRFPCHFLVSRCSFHIRSCWSVSSSMRFIRHIIRICHISSECIHTNIFVSNNIYCSVVFNYSSIRYNYSLYSCSICSRRCLNSSIIFPSRKSVNIHSSRIISAQVNSPSINCLWARSRSIHSNAVIIWNINCSMIFYCSFICCDFCSFIVISSRHSDSILLASHITWTYCNYSEVLAVSLRRVNSNISNTCSQVNISIVFSILWRINSISIILIHYNIWFIYNLSAQALWRSRVNIHWFFPNVNRICCRIYCQVCLSLWSRYQVSKRICISNLHVNRWCNCCRLRILAVICNIYPNRVIICHINLSTWKVYTWTCRINSNPVISHINLTSSHIDIFSVNSIRRFSNINLSSICNSWNLIINIHSNRFISSRSRRNINFPSIYQFRIIRSIHSCRLSTVNINLTAASISNYTVIRSHSNWTVISINRDFTFIYSTCFIFSFYVRSICYNITSKTVFISTIILHKHSNSAIIIHRNLTSRTIFNINNSKWMMSSMCSHIVVIRFSFWIYCKPCFRVNSIRKP